MVRTDRILAIIPARENSKRLPMKNIMNFCGRPLIEWTIDVAKSAEMIKRTIVSTDSERIAKIAMSCGLDVPFIRPDFLSTDEASSVDVVKHAISEARKYYDEKYDAVVLLQPTSPLRNSNHLTIALEKMFINSEVRSVVSVTRLVKNIQSLRQLKSNCFLNNIEETEGKDFVMLNGAIYITEVTGLLKEMKFELDTCLPFEMEPNESVDIDTIEDFDLAEYYFKRI